MSDAGPSDIPKGHTSAEAAPLLDPQRAAALGQSGDLARIAKSLADSATYGARRAAGRGGGTEFYDYRAYAAGDPARAVDWRVAGRTDRLYVRRSRHEGRLTLVCVVDASASMGFNGFGRAMATTKLRAAQEMAAALLFVAVRRGDRAGVIIAGAQGATVAPGAGWGALAQCLATLERARASGAAPDALAGGLGLAADMLPRGGVVIALGDALDEPGPLLEQAGRVRFQASGRAASAGLHGVARRDLTLVQTLAREELDLPEALRDRLRDPDGGATGQAGAPGGAQAYAARVRAHIDELRTGLGRLGAAHHVVMTHADLSASLREVLAG